MPGILWIASYPKSGNTWFRALIANYLTDREAPVGVNELSRFIVGDHRHSEYEQHLGRSLAGLSDEEIADLRPELHERLATFQQSTTLVKTHNACIFVDGRPLITPSATAGAVYIARNPMDVVVSFSHHFQIGINRAVEILCERGKTLPPSAGNLEVHLGSWSEHVTSWLDAPGMHLHLVRYEDLMEKPAATLAGLVKFLQLPLDDARLERAVEHSSFDNLKAQEEEGGFKEARSDGKSQFFRAGVSGGWKIYLKDHHVQALIASNGPVMTRLGYLREDGSLSE